MASVKKRKATVLRKERKAPVMGRIHEMAFRRFMAGLSYQEIGKDLGISAARAENLVIAEGDRVIAWWDDRPAIIREAGRPYRDVAAALSIGAPVPGKRLRRRARTWWQERGL